MKSASSEPNELSQPEILPGLIEQTGRSPLVMLRDTERSLRTKALETVTPVLPENLSEPLAAAAARADVTLNQLAAIDLKSITDDDLRPARIRVGLVWVGLGALMMVFLTLYLSTLHSNQSVAEQVYHYWHVYVGLLGVGITGLFMLGREILRLRLLDDEQHHD
jgi:hypothetical protein